MEIKGNVWDAARLGAAAPKSMPQSMVGMPRFRDMISVAQGDGAAGQDAKAQGTVLSDAEKQQLRSSYNIEEVASYSQRRALLNELVKLGAVSAEESELSLCQVLPPQGPGGTLQSGSALEGVLGEKNYLKYLDNAIGLDGLWNRSDDVKDARVKVREVLQSVYGTGV